MSATPEIKTKFSLGGLTEARAGFGRLAAGAKTSLDKVKTSAGEALKPMEKDIARAQRSLRGLQTAAMTTGRVGFGALKASAGLAFSAIKLGSISATVALGGIGAAAAKAANDSSVAMDRIAKDARRLGMSTEDVSVLGYAAEQEGVNPEEALKGIAKIGSEWAKIKQQIAASNDEFLRMQRLAKDDAIVSILSRDGSGLQAAADSVSSARSGSLAATQQRIAQIEAQLAETDVFTSRRMDPRQQLQRQVAVMALRRELSDLQKAQADIKKSFGPVGESMFGLQAHGLDIGRASKGGVEGLMALGDAIRNVQDPMERLRYSVGIFGEDAGPKMLNLLMAGRGGMEAYRKEAERLGIVVSAEQARMAEAYEDSKKNFARAKQGLKMELGGVFLPELTKAADASTAFVVKNRKGITALVKTGFEAVGNFAKDVYDLLNGKSTHLRTEWLQDFVNRIKVLRFMWAEFKLEIDIVMGGGKSRWPWLNTIAKGIRDAIALVQDLWRILQGRNAVDYPWLNKLRDDVMAVVKTVMEYVDYFGSRLKDAFDIVISALTTVRDMIKPITDLFGWDITTAAFVVGLLRITGILGMVLTAVGLIGKGIMGWGAGKAAQAGMTGLAGALGALAGGGVVGGAVAGGGVGMAAGGAAAGAVAARPSMAARAGSMAGRVLSKAALPVAIVDLGYQTGKGLGHVAWQYSPNKQSYDAAQAATSERVRLEGDRSYMERHNKLMRSDEDYMIGYWAERGVHIDKRGGGWWAERNGAAPRDPSPVVSNAAPATEPRVTERIAVDLNFNGNRVTGHYAPDQARLIKQEAERMSRMGGY